MKLYTIINRLLLGLSILTLMGCRKDIPNIESPENYLGRSFDDIFEVFWNGMNNNYVFWDIDTTDWDRVYRQYKPLFADLNLDNNEDIEKSFDYFRAMTDGLLDGHFQVSFFLPELSTNLGLWPAVGRLTARESFRDNIPVDHFATTIPNTYLDPEWLSGLGGAIISGTISNDISYLRINEFQMRFNYQSNPEYALVLDDFYRKVLAEEQPRGIVIDLRDNPGGFLADLDFFLGRMITEPLHFGYTKSKLSTNRLDYTPWIPARVNPTPGAKKVTAPIVVLCDLWSSSMSEVTTMAIRAMPNGYFIGEQTLGAMGPLTHNVIFNGGMFDGGLLTTVNFFQAVLTSSVQTVGLDKVSYEGIGLSPDQEVLADLDALSRGQDAQLEAAIEYINTR